MDPVGHHDKKWLIYTNQRAGKPPILPIFVCYIVRDFSVIRNSDIIFAKNLCGMPLISQPWRKFLTTSKTAHLQGQSRPWIFSRLDLTASPTRFHGRTSTEVRIPPFQQFSCAIAHHFLGDPEFDVKNAKKFCGRPSSALLCSRLFLTSSPTHFQG